jgi:uncharacterized protein (UPF0335 family)
VSAQRKTTKSKKLPRSMLVRLERAKKDLAKVRDDLREIYEEAEAIVDSADEAYCSLDYAVERLSEQV